MLSRLQRQEIDRAFANMLPSRRDEIYRRRTRHKRLAIFLHEWGHTLGAPHTKERDGLLYPSYDDDMTSYGEDSSELIASALPARFEAGAESPARAEATAPEAASAKRATSSELVELSSDDQITYRKAEAVAHGKDAEGALTLLGPLVERYPSSYAVQHMACGLLMQPGRSDQVQTVCSRVMQLSANRWGDSLSASYHPGPHFSNPVPDVTRGCLPDATCRSRDPRHWAAAWTRSNSIRTCTVSTERVAGRSSSTSSRRRHRRCKTCGTSGRRSMKR